MEAGVIPLRSRTIAAAGGQLGLIEMQTLGRLLGRPTNRSVGFGHTGLWAFMR